MMPLSEILFLSIVLYLLYRFVFNFLLPVVRATRQVREQFRNMQHPAGDQPGSSRSAFTAAENSAPPDQTGKRASGKAPAGDYIDFEEIK
jgi:hypothetical protein